MCLWRWWICYVCDETGNLYGCKVVKSRAEAQNYIFDTIEKVRKHHEKVDACRYESMCEYGAAMFVYKRSETGFELEKKRDVVSEMVDTDSVYPKVTDKGYEALWQMLGDIPMDPKTERIEEDFIGFPKGTPREDIWHWFDERYSKGVSALLYGGEE